MTRIYGGVHPLNTGTKIEILEKLDEENGGLFVAELFDIGMPTIGDTRRKQKLFYHTRQNCLRINIKKTKKQMKIETNVKQN